MEEGGEMKRSGAKILSERSADDQSVLGSSSKGWGATAAGGGLSDDDEVDDEQVGKEQVVEGGEIKRSGEGF